MGTIVLIILTIVMTLMFTFGPIKAIRNSRKEDDNYIIKVDNVDSIEFEPAKTEKTIKKEIIERVSKDESRKKYTKL